MTAPLPLIPDDTPIDLQESTRWTLRYNQLLIAERAVGGSAFSPIPEFAINLDFTSPILATQTLSTTDPGLEYHGKLTQVQSIGINASARLAVRSIYRGTQLIRFSQDLTGTYSLLFLPNNRLERVNVLVYEYLP